MKWTLVVKRSQWIWTIFPSWWGKRPLWNGYFPTYQMGWSESKLDEEKSSFWRSYIFIKGWKCCHWPPHGSKKRDESSSPKIKYILDNLMISISHNSFKANFWRENRHMHKCQVQWYMYLLKNSKICLPICQFPVVYTNNNIKMHL